MKKYKIGKASLAAPLGPVLVEYIQGVWAPSPQAHIFSFLFIYMWAFFCITLLGMPMYFLLNYFNLIRWWTAAIIGCIGGFLLTWLFKSHLVPTLTEFAYYSSLGILASLIFWFVWRYNNPDTNNSVT